MRAKKKEEEARRGRKKWEGSGEKGRMVTSAFPAEEDSCSPKRVLVPVAHPRAGYIISQMEKKIILISGYTCISLDTFDCSSSQIQDTLDNSRVFFQDRRYKNIRATKKKGEIEEENNFSN